MNNSTINKHDAMKLISQLANYVISLRINCIVMSRKLPLLMFVNVNVNVFIFIHF